MVLWKPFPILILSSYLASIAAAQAVPPRSSVRPTPETRPTDDFTEVVIQITSVKIKPTLKLGLTGKLKRNLGVDVGFGTGFCLDPACRFIGTNYHVAMRMTQDHKIKREEIVQRYLATGPHDKEATANLMSDGEVLAFAMKRDLAIFELARPLRHRHGLAFSLDELEAGQEVDIYSYPFGGINPFRKLNKFPAVFKAPTTSGLLAFEYQSVDKPTQMGGASGGIVVDRKTQKVVGILNGSTNVPSAMALAVRVRTLADFVSNSQPFLAEKIFPASTEVSPVSSDLYPKLAPPTDFNTKFTPPYVGVIQRRPEEPKEVTVLREKAQLLADSMRNFIAVQSYAWGSGNNEPEAYAEYEVRVVDGQQRFRSYPEGKKELDRVPYPRIKDWALGSDEWSDLPNMVGTEYRLKIRQADDVVVNGRRLKVFQYRSSVEDNLCPFKPLDNFIFFTVGKVVAVACYGEVWTDDNTNIVRISENLDLSDKLKEYKRWETYRVVITYRWLKIADEPSRLAPATVYTEGLNRKKIFWCRGQFTNYHVFTGHARIAAN